MNIKTSLKSWVESLAFALVFLPIALPAISANTSLETELSSIQQEWDRANYQSANAEEKRQKLAALSVRSEALTHEFPGRAEPLVWEGIVLSTYAGAKGGIGALSLARKSRDCLLEATRIDPAALHGSAYTSLGALYFKVPGWPIGFGDEEKANALLRKALALNPDGIDPNYFIGELLFEQGDYARALLHLQKALAAAPRPDRPIAEAGRRAEIQNLLAKVREKM